MQKEHRTDTEKDRQQSIKKGPEKNALMILN